MTDMLQKLADHTEDAGNYSIEWNPQRSYYESAAEYILDRDDLYDFETDAMKQRAIDENSLVVLQWYERTPVGFSVYAAPDLAALVAWVIKSIDTERKRAAPELPVRCTTCSLPKAARGSRVAERGGNPDWCWSGCGGYDAPPGPAELVAREQSCRECDGTPLPESCPLCGGSGIDPRPNIKALDGKDLPVEPEEMA